MQDYNIEVGDRVTYKYKGESNIFTRIITINSDAEITLKDDKEILKIERIGSNGWYTVYEKEKELLTEEEREFLKLYIKFNGKEIDFIEKSGRYIKFYIKQIFNNYLETARFYYYKSFENLEENKEYTLSELGLYEGE